MVDILIFIGVVAIIIILLFILFYLVKIKKLTKKLMFDIIRLSNVVYTGLSNISVKSDNINTPNKEELKPEDIATDDPIGSVFSIVDDLLSGKSSMDEVDNNES